MTTDQAINELCKFLDKDYPISFMRPDKNCKHKPGKMCKHRIEWVRKYLKQHMEVKKEIIYISSAATELKSKSK